MTVLTQDVLKYLLKYEPETGQFYWRNPQARCMNSGDQAGSVNGLGYIQITVSNKRYTTHRLAFLYMTGKMPMENVDHINHIKDDNRWVNLRESTGTQNQANTLLRKNNTSGYKGVTRDQNKRQWRAYINKNKKYLNLGQFDCKHEAAAAYNTAAIEVFGEFACLNDVPTTLTPKE